MKHIVDDVGYCEACDGISCYECPFRYCKTVKNSEGEFVKVGCKIGDWIKQQPLAPSGVCTLDDRPIGGFHDD